jgi:23S rRNA pseudouridine955/2504/2580 synthase
MTKDEKKNKVTVYDHPVPGAKTMVTRYKVLQSAKGLSLCEVELLTGRTHQIRAHMAHVGCPLLGDGKYGTNAANAPFGGYKKQFLYSYKTVFGFTSDAGMLDYLKGKSVEADDVWFAQAFPDKI